MNLTDTSNNGGDEEDTGPCVESADPEERVAARRLRIKKRLETQRRAQLGDKDLYKEEMKEELSKSRKQMEESRLRLTKLLDDGTELVTNIRVAGDAREGTRRINEEEARRERKEKLDSEAKLGAERFEDITKKWESALQKEIPQDLHQMLTQQRSQCENMIEEKNKLIVEFQTELKLKDDMYVKDLKKQADDVDLLIERMDEQVKQCTKAQREELDQIEKAFVTERTELLETQRKKWQTMMHTRNEREEEFMQARERRVDDFEEQLQHLRVQDAEEYNQCKIKLETDVQVLEQQLQQMKATYQLNQEKLEYNFQVLRKRDEENTITKSQQKRKITRLQDVLTNLKIKYAKQEKNYKDENTQLTEDYKRITEQFRELQKKSKHFMATDTRKFHDIWVMNESEAKELVMRVLEEDRLVHDQQLGLVWLAPELQFTENIGPIQSEQTKRRAVSANQVAREIITGQKSETSQSPSGELEQIPAEEHVQREKPKGAVACTYSPKLVKQILELLCDESGFLIESKLIKLLQPLDKNERSLMKLDAIFGALGVDTEDDIHQLAEYLTKVRKESDDHALAEEADQRSQKDSDDSCTEDEHHAERDGSRADSNGSKRHPSTKAKEAALLHPNEVLKALRAYVEDNKHPPKERGKLAQFSIASMEVRDDSDDSAYWLKYPNVLPESRERLWEGLLEGLEKYSDVLHKRTNLLTETNALRQQNAELRLLLHQYVNSKVNQELEIPPTRVLQMELNPN